MDRIRKAVDQLWGPLGKDGTLHSSPRFVDELSEHCNGNLGLCDTRVSKWSYGHQLEHLYRTSHYVLDRLEESMTGRNATERMGFWGAGLMVGGFIPRYWFPTIPQLVPASGTMEHIQPLKDELKTRVEQIQWRLDQIEISQGKSRHPRMKYLSASQWLFFQDVHHRHHLSIMRDILKVAG
jgi:DinB family protein